MELFHNAPATPPAPGSCDGRSRNRRIRTHWRQLPRLRGAKVTKQVRAGEKMHQEGYSKSGRNIIRNGHISGREAITSGEASPTGRHKKKDPYGSFCHIAATLSTASYTPPHAVFYTSAEQAGTKRKFHTQRAHFRSQTRRPSPVTLRIRALPEGSNPPPSRFSQSSGKRMSIGWAKTKRAPAV